MDSEGSEIEFIKIGCLVLVYFLIEGVEVDVVRWVIFKILLKVENFLEILLEIFLN